MRSVLFSLSIWLLSGCQTVVEHQQASAKSRFLDGTEALRLVYRQSLSKQIQSVTRGEIFLLDFQAQSEKWNDLSEALFPDTKIFPIRPYAVATRILKRHNLSAHELSQVLAVLPKTIADENREGSFCHYPIHGIRLYDGDTMLFETSICYHCRNFYVTFPDGQSNWVGLHGDQLQEVLTRIMPIPEAEAQRFKALNGTEPNKH
jgi:hypothetical protein